jgi:hypothetical protein
VHGKGIPKRGPVDPKNVLIVSPKINLVPDDLCRKLVALFINLLNRLLTRKEYLEIVQSGKSEETVKLDLDAYFVRLLLR